MNIMSTIQRVGGKLGVAILAATFCTSAANAKSPSSITGSIIFYDTSGGSILAAYQASFFPSFTKKTSVSITDDFNDGDSKFFAAVQAGRVPWSVIAFNTIADGLRAAKKGYLLPLDTKTVPVTKLEPGSYDNYGIHTESYGIVMAWNTKKWPLSSIHPTSWQDFYNVKKFPGRRCLYQSPQSGWVLESALLADGVAPEKLYPLDVKRAFTELDKLKGHIVWWTSGAQSVEYLATGQCDMGIIWSGRALAAVSDDHLPLAISWNGAGYTSDLFAVPKGAPNAKAGFAFLAHWINDRESQIIFVNKTGYPTQTKGLSLTVYDSSVRGFVAAGTNLKKAVRENDAYYMKNLAALNAQFTSWLSGF
jgi:putative spermidine/putrescine transport system substrate-binding protein